MHKIQILQISDVHFPDSHDSIIQDRKDNSIPGSLADKIAPHRLTSVLRKISEFKFDVVVLCGDLTSRGDAKGYADCLEYLATNTLIPRRDSKSEGYHAVPGNHDIVFPDKLYQDQTDLSTKFRPLVEMWKEYAELLPISTPRHSKVVNSANAGVALLSLNSCMGCREKRHLPIPIREELASIIEESRSIATDKNLSEIHELLDTPAFFYDHLDITASTIQQLPKSEQPVVIAHHNILPQVVQRLEIYTEVLNAGIARSRLSNLGRSVLYCHGHVHDATIEIVRSTGHRCGELICISAKPLSDGFNRIEIQFSENNLPMGAIVQMYELRSDGAVALSSEVRLPLNKVVEEYSRQLSARCGELVKRLPGKEYRIAKKLASGLLEETGISETDLADLICEAEWFGIWTIDNRRANIRDWTIVRSL